MIQVLLQNTAPDTDCATHLLGLHPQFLVISQSLGAKTTNNPFTFAISSYCKIFKYVMYKQNLRPYVAGLGLCHFYLVTSSYFLC